MLGRITISFAGGGKAGSCEEGGEILESFM